MVDDQDHSRGRGASGGRFEPDETRPFPPSGDEHRPDGGTRPGDDPQSWISDRTQQVPRTPAGPDPADRTRMLPPTGAGLDDATRVAPGAGRVDPTAMMPRVDAPDAGRAEAAARASAGHADGRDDAVWSARAQVPTRRPGQGGDFTPSDWAPAAPGPRGAWWLPIVYGVVGFLLLGALGVGVWLIVQGTQDETETAGAVPTVPAKPSKEPTAAAPTTTKPKPSPTPQEPADIRIPEVAGKPVEQARDALEEVELDYRLEFRRSDSVPAGTVIDSDPGAGREVSPDTEVTLVVSSGGAPSAPSATPSPDEGEPAGDAEPPEGE